MNQTGTMSLMRGFGTPCLSVALRAPAFSHPHPASYTSPIQPIVRNCHQSLAASQHPRPSYHHHTNGKCPLTRFCPHRWLSLVVPRLSHRGRIESGSSSCQAPSPTQHHQFFEEIPKLFYLAATLGRPSSEASRIRCPLWGLTRDVPARLFQTLH